VETTFRDCDLLLVQRATNAACERRVHKRQRILEDAEDAGGRYRPTSAPAIRRQD
jgi:hypothetical protein